MVCRSTGRRGDHVPDRFRENIFRDAEQPFEDVDIAAVTHHLEVAESEEEVPTEVADETQHLLVVLERAVPIVQEAEPGQDLEVRRGRAPLLRAGRNVPSPASPTNSSDCAYSAVTSAPGSGCRMLTSLLPAP